MPRSFLLPSVGSPKILPTVEQKYSELFSKEIFRDFQKISLKEYFFFFTFIDFQSITSHCKATSVFNIGFTPPLGEPTATRSAVFLNIVQKAFDPPPPSF